MVHLKTSAAAREILERFRRSTGVRPNLWARAALGYSLSVPLIEVNHLIAHIYANLMHYGDIKFPLMGLVVSGGHTSIMFADDIDRWRVIGQTQDDAAGEAFDKVAKILGLGYPGGPIIEKRASSGDPKRIQFPRSQLKDGAFDFSFSGIKTAVLYYVRRLSHDDIPKEVDDICAAFQEAVCDMIVEKTMLACRKKRISTLVVGGGVIANKRLRLLISGPRKLWSFVRIII